MTKLAISIIVLMMFFSLAFASNPLLKQSSSPKKQIVSVSNNSSFLYKINMIQKDFKIKMVKLGKRVKAKNSISIWLMLLGISFLYGVVHAVGPGHGKIIATSYFINSKNKLIHPIIYGISFSITHSLSALLTIIIIYFILKAPMISSFSNTADIALIISYVMIMIVGILLLIKAIKKNYSCCNHDHAHSIKELLSISGASGLVPCPGALVILSFSIAINYLILGVLSVIAMALGMAITISSLGLIVTLTKNTMINKTSINNQKLHTIEKIFSITGATALIIISVFFLVGSMT